MPALQIAVVGAGTAGAAAATLLARAGAARHAVLFSRYRDVAMYPWHAERIVFIGDAAHAMSPQLGHGANLALVDAVALADALATAPDVARALAAYSAARKHHLAFYQFATRALTPLFQGDSRVLRWLRDRTFPTSRWFRWFRRRTVRTMVGIDRRLLRGGDRRYLAGS